MNILVTNDDGVTAPGLMALAKAMQSLGTIKFWLQTITGREAGMLKPWTDLYGL